MPHVQIKTDSGVDASIAVFSGIAKASGKPYKCVLVTVGEWQERIFLKPLEIRYLEEQLGD